MPAFQRIMCALSVLLLAVLLYGIHRRNLHSICRWLAPYLAAVLLGDLAWVLWPHRFYGWEFYVAKETVYGILKLVLAIDLGATMFSAFPGAAAAAKYSTFAALVAICAVLAAVPTTGARLDDLAVELHPRLANGTAFLLLSVWALAFLYHIPTHRFHRALLAGLSAYLFVFTLLLGYLVTPRSPLHALVSLADAFGYLALLGYWVWETWRREPALHAHPDVLRRLQPWRPTRVIP